MQVLTYNDPAEFLNRAQSFLEARETANNLILGVTLRLKEMPEWTDLPPYLATVQGSDGDLILAGAITPPHNLQLASQPDAPVEELDAALEALVENLRAGGITFPGVIAEYELARRFARLWAERMRLSYHTGFEERVYELRQVTPPPNPPAGRLRIATMDDFEIIRSWYTAFTTELFGTVDEEYAATTVRRRIASGGTYIWDDNGPVSMAVRTRPTPHGESVGGVYTPPEKRGCGYASACVAALSQVILDSGKQFCNLFTDLSNPTSNAIYQKIGYRPVCDFTVYKFSE
jgi:uncharacterized protein